MGVATIEEVKVIVEEISPRRVTKTVQITFAGVRDPRQITDEERLKAVREKEPGVTAIVEVIQHWKDAG